MSPKKNVNMEEWKRVRLGDIATFSNGVNFGKDSYCQGVKLIGVSDFGNRLYPAYDELQEISTKVVRANDYLYEGDIVFVRSNGNKELVGRCMLVTANHPSVTYSGFCIRARLNDLTLYNPLFFTYYFKNKGFRKVMSGTAVGANIQNLSQARLAQHEVLVPSIEVQNKIATILSRYDDLIENYQKQIKLLEEAAQRLYKEWFVDFHFPGHENVQVVDGVPDGWEKKTLGDLADIIMGQSPKSIYYNKVRKGLPFHQGVGSYGYRFVNDDTYSSCATRIAEANSILFSVRAPVGRLNLTKNRIIIGRGLAALNEKEGLQSYLFYMLKERFFKDNIIGNGSIFASISKDDLYGETFIVPAMKLRIKFNDLASHYDAQIKALDSQLRLLTEARNRLLSKLMSGEIEV